MIRTLSTVVAKTLGSQRIYAPSKPLKYRPVLALVFALLIGLAPLAYGAEPTPKSSPGQLVVRDQFPSWIKSQPAERQPRLQLVVPLLASAKTKLISGLIIEQLTPDQKTSELITAGIIAGKDVRYAVVYRPESSQQKTPRRFTLTYSPEVAGTDLIYNLTDGFLQGKARPFDVQLAPGELLLFCILPFQLEQVATQEKNSAEGPVLQVQFETAAHDTIQGVLPLALYRMSTDSMLELDHYVMSNEAGQFLIPLKSYKPPKGKLSLFTLLGQAPFCDVQFNLELTPLTQ